MSYSEYFPKIRQVFDDRSFRRELGIKKPSDTELSLVIEHMIERGYSYKTLYDDGLDHLAIKLMETFPNLINKF